MYKIINTECCKGVNKCHFMYSEVTREGNLEIIDKSSN